MPTFYSGTDSVQGLSFAVVVSRFNPVVTEALLESALRTFLDRGVHPDQIHVARVPGAFEIPVVARRMAQTGRFDAVLCLGAVVRGETPHFDYIAAEVSRGISAVALETGVPVLMGVLTVDTLEQAMVRAGLRAGSPHRKASDAETNRGRQGALAAIEMATLLRQLKTL